MFFLIIILIFFLNYRFQNDDEYDNIKNNTAGICSSMLDVCCKLKKDISPNSEIKLTPENKSDIEKELEKVFSMPENNKNVEKEVEHINLLPQQETDIEKYLEDVFSVPEKNKDVEKNASPFIFLLPNYQQDEELEKRKLNKL